MASYLLLIQNITMLLIYFTINDPAMEASRALLNLIGTTKDYKYAVLPPCGKHGRLPANLTVSFIQRKNE